VIGLTFPAGLVYILLLGGELWTGNCMFYTVALAERLITVKAYFWVMMISFVGNYAGTGLVAYFFGDLTEFFVDPALTSFLHLCERKVTLGWGVVFLRSIPANWLVCIAVFLSTEAEDLASTVLVMYIPICCFAATGFEHCIANMFFLQLGLFLDADYTLGEMWYNNLIPVAIGNFIGGGIFLGMFQWYIYSFGEEPLFKKRHTPVDWNLNLKFLSVPWDYFTKK